MEVLKKIVNYVSSYVFWLCIEWCYLFYFLLWWWSLYTRLCIFVFSFLWKDFIKKMTIYEQSKHAMTLCIVWEQYIHTIHKSFYYKKYYIIWVMGENESKGRQKWLKKMIDEASLANADYRNIKFFPRPANKIIWVHDLRIRLYFKVNSII